MSVECWRVTLEEKQALVSAVEAQHPLSDRSLDTGER